MNKTDFRNEVNLYLPGFKWKVKNSSTPTRLEAVGTRSSGMNRTATLSVIRTEPAAGL